MLTIYVFAIQGFVYIYGPLWLHAALFLLSNVTELMNGDSDALGAVHMANFSTERTQILVWNTRVLRAEKSA